MKKIILILFTILSFTLSVKAQDTLHKPCGNPYYLQQLIKNSPNYYVDEAELEKFTQKYVAEHNDTRSSTRVIIPVVFHIIHAYGTENISDDQVRDAVRIMNADYQQRNPDTADVVSGFKSIVANCNFEFRLAKIDPKGNCTSGIEHIFSYNTFTGDDGSKLDPWDRKRYLNIWAVQSIGLVGYAGYAYTPAGVVNNSRIDGVILLSNYIGSIGTGSNLKMHALTHEIGHTLNLQHPWGSTNVPGVACGDDGVLDTPETEGWDHCNLTGSVCHPPAIENVQNFMEYSYCSDMFTLGQKSRMMAALSAHTSWRDTLWSEHTLRLTGTYDTAYHPICKPVADFYSKNRYLCTNTNVAFYDVSWGGAATSRKWIFKNASIDTSASVRPLVSFNTAGWQTVMLIAINANGSDTLTKKIFISDPSSTDYTGGFYESFETSTTSTTKWLFDNLGLNQSTFSINDTVGYNGGKHCAMLNSYYSRVSDVDDMISPSVNLTGHSGLYFNFRYACATSTSKISNMKERMGVYYSTNCGKSWNLLWMKDSTDLINNGFYGSEFVPDAYTTWRQVALPLPSAAMAGSVRFKFEYVAGVASNDLYIDDINVSIYSGTKTITDPITGLRVYPNPVYDGHARLTFTYNSRHHTVIRVTDIMGNEIATQSVEQALTPGVYDDDIDTHTWPAGVYMVTVATDGYTYIKKLVVQ